MTNVTQIQEYSTHALIETKWLTQLFAGVAITIPAQIFGLQTELLIGLMVLVLFDIISGVARSKINGETITSNKLSMSVIKIILYLVYIISSYIVSLAYPAYAGIHTMVFGFLILINFKSIIENLTGAGIIIPAQMRDWLEQALNWQKTRDEESLTLNDKDSSNK